ncbi:MAG TPA: N-acetylglucosamine-6-phosphate deacetylase [Silvibacterium sp.]|nr:N-acetylglucosamine-6-phosphate deacetylase [Silvibacterium sp.]
MNPIITIEGPHILEICPRDAKWTSHVDYEFPNGILTSSFFDIHFHGIAGQDVMNASSEGFQKIGYCLARAGVARFLPTTVTASLDTTLSALERMAEYIESAPSAGASQAVGIHIEGPFLSPAKRGMHSAEHLLRPTPELLNRFWEAARGKIRLMTIAPELPGALETIQHATVLGIRSAIGHSMATHEEAIEGIRSGAVSATHTFNAMREWDHREPGILGAVLDQNDLYADLICDNCHVAPAAVRLWFKAKGPERAILITDCLSAAGMRDGRFLTGETIVHVEGEACRTEAGVLAGSVITLDRAVANFMKIARADLHIAAQLASINPTRMLGLPELLVPGAPADFNVYDTEGIRCHTFIRGLLSE